MSASAAVAVARSSSAPAVATPVTTTQTQSVSSAGAMQNVATPAVSFASVTRTEPSAGSIPGASVVDQKPKSLLERGVSWLGDAASGALEFGEQIGWSLLNQYAPELVPIIKQGPLEWMKEQVGTVIESLFDTLMTPVRSITGIGHRLSRHLAPLLALLQDAAAKIAKNDCSPLREAADKIEQMATRLIQPIVEFLQPVVAKIQTFFSDIWEKFGTPIWEWIKKVAAKQWEKVQALASWVWDKTEPIRKILAKAWTWIKNKLGIGEGPEGQNGILQWVQGKLGAAWDWVKAKLEPYKKEITTIAAVVGGLVLLFSPVGPFIVIGGLVYGVIQAVRWIKANWGKGVVKVRDFVQKTLIPGLLKAANSVASKFTSVAAAIAGALNSFSAGMGRLVGAAAGSALSFVVKAAQWIADQVDSLAVWAREKLSDLVKWMRSAFDKLQTFGQHIMDFLAAVGRVVSDVYAIQGKILKKLWDMIPACIRDPVVDFLIPLIIRQIELFQELVRDNEAWQKTKADVMNILHLVFETHDLKGAVRAVFDLVLRVFNIPEDLLVTIKKKAVSAWDIVSKQPLAFIKNLIRSIGNGFSRLWKNLKSHVMFGLEGWLLGPLAEQGIHAPSSWTDPKAVFGFVLEVMGLSVDHIFELLKKRFDPDTIEKIRSVFGKVTAAWDWITKAIDTSKSPAENTNGLIDQAKGFAGSVFTGVAEWIVGKVAVEVAAYATAAAASAGVSAVLDAFRRIYKALLTAKRWMRQILDMVNQALDDVLAVAKGEIEVVGEKFEKLLHRGMPVVIGFLGDQVGLGGVSDKIRELVEDLRTKVDDAILWLIDKIKAGLQALAALAKAGVQALLKWWKSEEPIPTTDGTKHRIYLDGDENSARVMVASSPMDTAAAVQAVNSTSATADEKKEALELKKTVDDAVVKLVARNTFLKQEKLKPGNRAETTDDQIQKQHTIMRTAMKQFAILLGKTVFGESKELSGTYKEAEKVLDATKVSFESANGKAFRAKADPLSAKRKDGSPPSVAPMGWIYIQEQGLTEKWPSYKQMHLINENFEGPGNTFENLVPGSHQNNADHLNTAETQIKKIVGKEKYLRGEESKTFGQMWYTAKVVYQSDDPKYPTKPQYIGKIKKSDFAESIELTWGLYKRKGGKWEKQSTIGNFTVGPIPLPDL